MKNTKTNPPMNIPAIFEKFKIRRHFDEKNQKWFFSIVDVVAALTEQSEFQKARKYWNKLKERLIKEGSQLVTNCHQLKMQASDGKFYSTDIGDLEVIFRLIQSIPSPKAEPIKMWLAKGGKISRDARLALEEKIGQKVVSGSNFLEKTKSKKLK